MSQGTIKRQVVVEGNQIVFEAGEVVEIEDIKPNPQNPAFKYVVTSQRLQRKFQLSDADVQASQAQPQVYPPEVPYTVAVPAIRKNRFWRPAVVIPLVVVLVAVVGVALFFVLGGKSGSPVAGKTYSLSDAGNFVKYNFYNDGTVLFTGSVDTSMSKKDYYKVEGQTVNIYDDSAMTDKRATMYLSSDGTTLTTDNGLELKQEP